MKLQKLVVVMSALAGGVASVNSYALSLGEVKLYSALNQPLVAEIELMQVNNLTSSEVLSNLASKSDFKRAGVQRPLILSSLRFKTEVGPEGKGIIRVTSDGPIHEPYLNFLVEVHWPSGRQLREYTLLLDPPVFDKLPAGPVVKPITVPSHYGANPVWDEPPTTSGDYLPSPEPVEYKDKDYNQRYKPLVVEEKISPNRNYSSAAASVDDGPARTYRISRNERLWDIAEKVRPNSSVTVQQTMLAIQSSNPQAFIDNNINRIKSGQVLRIPTRDDISSFTVREAVADVARQNREWRGGRRSKVAQLDATRKRPAVTRDTKKLEDGKLAIVSGDAVTKHGRDLGGDSAKGNKESAAFQTLRTEHAMTKEKLGKLGRENAELKSRLKDLDDQIATLKRLITMKDDQIAALQTQGAQSQYKPKPVNKPPVPFQQSEVMEKPSMMSGLFGSLLVFLLAVIPVAGAAWLFYQRRKKQQEALANEDDDVDFRSLDLDNLNKDKGVQKDVSPKSVTTPSADEMHKFDEALAIDDSIIKEVEADDGEITQQTEDPLSEADIYIAYGRLKQAEELLNQAILNEPARADLRLKLLEVHSENGELDKFNQVLADLEATGDADAIREADAFKVRFPDAFADAVAAEAEDEMPDLDLDELDLDDLDDLDFDLSEFDVGSELDAVSDPEVASQPESGQGDGALGVSSDDGGLGDLDFDFDSEATDPLARDSLAAFSDKGGSNLEASLDGDFDLISESEEVATKLDLARAYVDMGDMDGASVILQEVIEQGSDEQKQEAMSLLENSGAS